MTKNKRFTLAYADYDWWAICDKENPTERGISGEDVVDLLNDLHKERNYFERKKCEYWNKFNFAHLDNINLRKENEQLKQQIKDLYKFVKYDVDNEIDVYPKSILKHLVNILKIIGDVE